jgi:hypothetical protein
MRFPAIVVGLLLSVALPLAAQDHSPERERARQQYIKFELEYQYQPERTLQVCEARAEREKMLRSQNRIDELDAEIIARDEEWKREDKRIRQALEDERAARPVDTRTDLEKFRADGEDSIEVIVAKNRIAMKNSPALQALDFHMSTSDDSCKLALSSVDCYQMNCGAGAPVPSAPPAPVNYSFPTPAPRKPSYRTPSHTATDVDIEAETERVRQLEKKVNDLEDKNK